MTSEPTNADLHLLRPHLAVAERVVCPGDPGRALRVAQDLTDGVPRMLNHHRGLWGYDGVAPDGGRLTVQGTGVGGPSAALVVADLVALGARRLVRVGTASAVDASPALGAVCVASRVLASDGTSRALGAGGVVMPDPELTGALLEGADAGVVLGSADVRPGGGPTAAGADGGGRPTAGIDGGGGGASAGAVAWDLQSAAFLAAAAAGGARAAVVVVVARDAGGRRLADEALHEAELRAGRLALSALV